MAKWQSRIELADLWEARERDELTIVQLAKAVAVRIRVSGLAWFRFGGEGSDLDTIADSFDSCGDDVEEFDSYLEELYDWGDEALDDQWNGRKRCWINTCKGLASKIDQ